MKLSGRSRLIATLLAGLFIIQCANASPPQEDRLVLLGTKGGPSVRSSDPLPSSNVLVVKGVPYVIDTGYGVTLRLVQAKIALADLRYVFVTHHHSDHNLEYGNLLYNAWTIGLRTAR